MTAWLALALLGALVGLDSTGFPQVMFSRPLVAGALAGLIFGRPVEGMLVGASLEIFELVILPVGAARYPEAGTGAVAAAAALGASLGHGPTAALLVLAVVFGLGWERLAGLSVILLRRRNEWLVAGATPLRAAADVERRHLAALTADLLRGALLALAGGLAGTVLLRALGPLWGLGAGPAAGLITVALAGIAATALPLFGGFRDRRVVFIAGLVCGSLLVMLAR